MGLPWSYVSAGHAILTWMLDVLLPWLDVSAGRAFLTWMLDVFLPWSDISVENVKTYVEARPPSSKVGSVELPMTSRIKR